MHKHAQTMHSRSRTQPTNAIYPRPFPLHCCACLLQAAGSASSAAGSGGALPQWLKPLGRFFERTSSDPFYAVVAYRNFKRE